MQMHADEDAFIINSPKAYIPLSETESAQRVPST